MNICQVISLTGWPITPIISIWQSKQEQTTTSKLSLGVMPTTLQLLGNTNTLFLGFCTAGILSQKSTTTRTRVFSYCPQMSNFGVACGGSLLHHLLEQRAKKGSQVYLHANNCVGQNKNNVTIQYLAWRVLSGKHKSITLTFMLSGHTKFPQIGILV